MVKIDKESAKLLKVDELKAALKARRCSTGGKKSELCDRLVEYLDAEDAPKEEQKAEHTDLQAQVEADQPASTEESASAGEPVGVAPTEEVIEVVPAAEISPPEETEAVAAAIIEEPAATQPVPVTEDSTAGKEEMVEKEAVKAKEEEAEVRETVTEKEEVVVPSKEEDKEVVPFKEVEVEAEEGHTAVAQTEAVTAIYATATDASPPVASVDAAATAAVGAVGAASSGQLSVRIDNFQRPLTDKILFEWLAKTLGHEVKKEQLWMNKIKTHCYIDLETPELASACIAAVTGLKVDSKHTMQLVANFTDVSATQAEDSFEAKLKPNEWQNKKGGSNSTSSASQMPAVNPPYDAAKKANLLLATSIDKGITPSMESIRGNATVGFSTRRNLTTTGLEQPPAKRQNIGERDPSSSAPYVHPNRQEPKNIPQNQKNIPEQNIGDIVELDSLFRKTKAIPPLYWLPVSEEVLLKRKLLSTK